MMAMDFIECTKVAQLVPTQGEDCSLRLPPLTAGVKYLPARLVAPEGSLIGTSVRFPALPMSRNVTALRQPTAHAWRQMRTHGPAAGSVVIRSAKLCSHDYRDGITPRHAQMGDPVPF